MQEESYRGYLIKYHFTSQWFALICRPGSALAMGGNTITATKDEGPAILLKRAHQRIDEEEAKAADKNTTSN